MTLSTAEQTIYFMLNNLRLSVNDHRFFSNLLNVNVLVKKFITSNQVTLFKEIVHKYNKQFLKMKINTNHVAELEWATKIVESAVEAPYLYIDGDSIKFKAPFNRQFISANLRSNTPAVWNNQEKVMIIPANQFALRDILIAISDSYGDINYCPYLQEQISKVISSRRLTWNPTLCLVNGNYIIMAITEALNDALNETTMPTTNLAYLSRMSRMGVTIGDSVLQSLSNDDIILLSDKQVEADISDADHRLKVKHLISSTASDAVYSMLINRQHHTWLEEITLELGIPYYSTWSDFNMYKFPLLVSDIHSTPLATGFTKNILLLDSTPINLDDEEM